MTPSLNSSSRAELPPRDPLSRAALAGARNARRTLASAFLILLFSSTHVLHADWPQFLGPQRDGSAPAPPRESSWTHEDQAGKPRWKIKVGSGFSSPIILNDRVLLFHRLGDRDILEAFQLKDGQSLWKLESTTRYVDDFGFDDGPRATPTASGNIVVTLNAEGHLQPARVSPATRLWEIASKEQFNARKGFFGLASSPLIVGDLVIAPIGGTDGAAILGVDLNTGKITWKTGQDESSYASPIPVTWQGKKRALVLTRESLLALAPESGSVLWSYAWRPSMHASVSAATPLVQNQEVFLSASYGTPAVLLRCNDSGPTEVWKDADAMANHYATCVLYEGHLYGFHGRQESGCALRCIEWATGKVKWTQDNFGAGTLLRVGNQLLILAESGELIRATASPQGFKTSARFQIIGAKTRAHAAYSQGSYVARSPRELVCLQLLPPPAPAPQ